MTTKSSDLAPASPSEFTFTEAQIKQLFLRLRQTKQELLYDVERGRVRHYKLNQRGGKILGVAHCDFAESAWSMPEWLKNDPATMTIRAGQVDDRVGVWILLDVLPSIAGFPQFDFLLTDDEESGQSTAQDVKEKLDYNWTFQFDRRGTDFVDYGKASKNFITAFEEFTGIPHGVGTFSDICYLPASCGSRVNIGTAYYDEHNPDAYVDLVECASQVEKFIRFAKEFSESKFGVPPEASFKTRRGRGYHGYGFGLGWSKKDEEEWDERFDDHGELRDRWSATPSTRKEAKQIVDQLNGEDQKSDDAKKSDASDEDSIDDTELDAEIDVDADLWELEDRYDHGDYLTDAELDVLVNMGIIDYSDADEYNQLHGWY